MTRLSRILPTKKKKNHLTLVSRIIDAEECAYCNASAILIELDDNAVCEECHENCLHDVVECGQCQSCGRSINSWRDGE